MDKKLLKELIVASITNGVLNEEIVLGISQKLKRKQLKEYLKALKKTIQELTIYVESPFELTNQQTETLEELFPSKKIKSSTNKSDLLGIKIQENDMIYDFTLRNRLDTIIKGVKEYD